VGLPVPEGLRVKSEDAGPIWPRDKIVVGKIAAVERHPNADRLTLATVEYGAAQPKTVVTGAPNIKVGDSGQKVILAVAGSVLVDDRRGARGRCLDRSGVAAADSGLAAFWQVSERRGAGRY